MKLSLYLAFTAIAFLLVILGSSSSVDAAAKLKAFFSKKGKGRRAGNAVPPSDQADPTPPPVDEYAAWKTLEPGTENPLSASVHQFAEKYLKDSSQIPQEAFHDLQTNIGVLTYFPVIKESHLQLGDVSNGPMSRKEFSLYLQAFLQVEYCDFEGASYGPQGSSHGRLVESMEGFPEEQLFDVKFVLQCPVGKVTVSTSLASKPGYYAF